MGVLETIIIQGEIIYFYTPSGNTWLEFYIAMKVFLIVQYFSAIWNKEPIFLLFPTSPSYILKRLSCWEIYIYIYIRCLNIPRVYWDSLHPLKFSFKLCWCYIYIYIYIYIYLNRMHVLIMFMVEMNVCKNPCLYAKNEWNCIARK